MVKKINKKQSYINIKSLVWHANEQSSWTFMNKVHDFLPTLFWLIYIDKVIIHRVVSRLTNVDKRYQLIETAHINQLDSKLQIKNAQ
jgi:hypothetical protein